MRWYLCLVHMLQQSYCSLCQWSRSAEIHKTVDYYCRTRGYIENSVIFTDNHVIPFLHIYTFIQWANSVDPDLPAHQWCLIKICTVCLLIKNNPINQKANGADPDQMARMCQLIWIYIAAQAIKVYIWRKGLYWLPRILWVNHLQIENFHNIWLACKCDFRILKTMNLRTTVNFMLTKCKFIKSKY
jgi:hypothetical protein